ncbi:hypothetical protein BN2476_850030 [Paraburkholderia piptadeniae]|uniref:Uncharacterized protein n=1 Tax=Paraburkholderia piptadeniae TaxID=1701573 RepID=A0A1N7SUJ8_9BURK|nr:hypothetical protein BN2476_850030 [Paraburkholderia piptadeniae]
MRLSPHLQSRRMKTDVTVKQDGSATVHVRTPRKMNPNPGIPANKVDEVLQGIDPLRHLLSELHEQATGFSNGCARSMTRTRCAAPNAVARSASYAFAREAILRATCTGAISARRTTTR